MSEVVSRGEWDAASPRRAMTPLTRVMRQVLHHSAGVQLRADAKPEREAEVVREIQDGHFARGFADVGYHYLVAPSGRIYEGRDPRFQGAGVEGHNTYTVHVCILGNYMTAKPTKKAIEGAARAFRKLPGKRQKIVGHRYRGVTDCPGDNLEAKIPAIVKVRDQRATA